MKTLSGFNPQTAQNLLLDSGAYFVNFDIATDTFDTAQLKLLGATSGGGKFEAKPTIRQIKVDGVKGKAKGLQVIDAWDVTMSAKILEFRKETFQRALAASKSSTTTINGAGYTKIEGKNQIDSTDYIDNITWIGTLSGTDQPVIIQVFNALSSSGLKIESKDKDDITADLDFDASYDATSLNTVPFAIYYPDNISDSTPPTVTSVPLDAATGVLTTANIVFTFSEAIAPSTVNSANFVLIKASDGTVVPATLTISTDNKTITLDPTTNLTAATAYIAIINTNVSDIYGNKLAKNTVINFTTA